MKNLFLFVTVIVTLAAAYVLGMWQANNNWRDEVRHNADGILAYQHYFEACEDIMNQRNPADSMQIAEYESAKKQLQDYHANVVMTWPEVCDQRDMLSDAIRCFAEHHPDWENTDDDIFTYVSEFGINPENLANWSYSY